jgi:small subunit ribosomal protein S6
VHGTEDLVRQYELVLMLTPDITEERFTGVMDRVRRVIGDHQGEITAEDRWGRRRLAYKIGRHTEANYHLAHLRMEGDGTQPLETALKLADDVIRHLLVREDEQEPTEPKKEEAEAKEEAGTEVAAEAVTANEE